MARQKRDTRLTTLASAKLYLDPASDGIGAVGVTTHDASISNHIRGASNIISNFCERRFEAAVYAGYSLRLDGNDEECLYLPHWPIAQPEPTHSAAFTLGGTFELQQGDTITGATSGETAIVCGVGWLTSGTWEDGDAAGTLYLASPSDTFTATEDLNVEGDLNVATITADPAALSTTFGVWVDAGHDFASSSKLVEEIDGVSGSYLIQPGDLSDGGGFLRHLSKWPRGHQNIKIVQLLGYSQIPYDLQHAAERLVAKMYEQQTVVPHTETSLPISPDGGTASPASRSLLPDDVKALLRDNYKRAVL